jgi:acetyltransferase
MIQAFVRNLSGASCYFRFFQALKGLSPDMLKRFTCVDDPDQMALVAATPIRGRKGIIGEARYYTNNDGATAEIAIVVADEWQRRGVGRGLLQILESIAVANGVSRLTGEAFARNDKFASFARGLGFETWPDHDPTYLRFEKRIGGTGAFLFKGSEFASF